MCRKRYKVIYEVAGLISKKQAEQAVNFAQTLVEEITAIITGQNRLEIWGGAIPGTYPKGIVCPLDIVIAPTGKW